MNTTSVQTAGKCESMASWSPCKEATNMNDSYYPNIDILKTKEEFMTFAKICEGRGLRDLAAECYRRGVQANGSGPRSQHGRGT